MDKAVKYRNILINFFNDYEAYFGNNKNDTVKTQLIVDAENNYYHLVRFGWKNDKYIHYCVFHIDLIGEKVWIQENRTDILIADELVELGISKSDIVLGLLHPSMRKDSDFASA